MRHPRPLPLAHPAHPARTAAIARAFDRADHYDAHAHTQRTVATRLADRIAGLAIDTSLPALEIGCGTGFLTQALRERLPGLRLTASDIAPAMLARAQAKLGTREGLSFALIDGEAPPAPPPSGYGLIASSLAFQWFADLPTALVRLAAQLSPGGTLAFATLTHGSFAQWHAARQRHGLGPSPAYPDEAALIAACPPGCTIAITRHDLIEPHPDGLAFTRHLRRIGAHTPPNPAPRPNPAALRKALRAFEEDGSAVTYAIAEVVIRRE